MLFKRIQARKDLYLYKFLIGDGKDSNGRQLVDIWYFDYAELERVHDYVQWLFPLNERSAYNSKAPYVTEDFIRKYAADTLVQRNMLWSLELMLYFYGFDFTGSAITLSKNFDVRSVSWLTKNNHNYLRITRILKSLKLFGMGSLALEFFKVLELVYTEHNTAGAISVETHEYWVQAVK